MYTIAELESRIKAYKIVAYSSVTFSVTAVVCICIALPMLQNYVNHVKHQITREMLHCQVNFSAINPTYSYVDYLDMNLLYLTTYFKHRLNTFVFRNNML